MVKHPRIAVLGSINMDLVVRCKALPRPGQTITADDFFQVPGGKGANQAVAAARLGAHVSLIGRVGNDAFGATLRANLMSENIDVQFLRTSKCSTGVAIVAVDDSGQNSIVVVPGANGQVSVEDVIESADAIKQSDALLVQLETPVAAVIRAIEIARQANIPTFLNPAPLPPQFDNRLYKADVLCVNQTEAEQLIDCAIGSVEEALSAVMQLAQLGPRSAIITLGELGAVWSDGKQVTFTPAFPIKAIDTTAAGDAFCAAFCVSVANNSSPDHAMRFASAAGAIAATRLGAQTSLPSHSEVEMLAFPNQQLP
jgi:ribokinase